jgi:hydroxymethylpyrimidine pyrophosphatase-like HAD family hydrolase
VNKSTGLQAALKELNVAPQEVVGVGDAENDHAFLDLCGLSVAVQNALPAVKQRVNYVTSASHGAGIVELIDRWVSQGLQDLKPDGRSAT